MPETLKEGLERLIQAAAPLPTEPSEEEEAFQSDGNDPSTPVPDLTTEELIQSQIARRHELANVITSDEIDRQRHLDELRDKYIPKLYTMMILWLIFVGLSVVGTGMKWLLLSDAVLIALVTTTTATVLGIFIIVAKWLFPPPKEK